MTGTSSALPNITAVAIADHALLIEGAPQTGKTSLALALIDRGAVLIGDDGLTVTIRNDVAWAEPPPNTAGLIEVRNVGLITMPGTPMFRSSAATKLLISRSENISRSAGSIGDRPLRGLRGLMP